MIDEPDDAEARFRQIREELSNLELPGIPDEVVDARKEEIQKQIEEAGYARMPAPPDLQIPPNPMKEKERQLQLDRKANKGLGIGLSIAYTLMALTMAGIGIGWLFDRNTGGTLGRGLGSCAGMTLGLILALRLIKIHGDDL